MRMTRKPGPRQYFGLMGKKDSGKEISTNVYCFMLKTAAFRSDLISFLQTAKTQTARKRKYYPLPLLSSKSVLDIKKKVTLQIFNRCFNSQGIDFTPLWVWWVKGALRIRVWYFQQWHWRAIWVKICVVTADVIPVGDQWAAQKIEDLRLFSYFV